MACYQRKHPGNIFFLYWMLDVGHQEISKTKFKQVVGSEISASEVRNQEFKALKPLSQVRGHNFRPIFF